MGQGQGGSLLYSDMATALRQLAATKPWAHAQVCGLWLSQLDFSAARLLSYSVCPVWWTQAAITAAQRESDSIQEGDPELLLKQLLAAHDLLLLLNPSMASTIFRAAQMLWLHQAGVFHACSRCSGTTTDVAAVGRSRMQRHHH